MQRGDWHTAEYPGRDMIMWQSVLQDLKTSFPRGGSPVTVGPFWQDDRTIYSLKELGLSEPIKLLMPGNESVVVLTKTGPSEVRSGKTSPASVPGISNQVKLGDATYAIVDSRLVKVTLQGNQPITDIGKRGLPDSDARNVALSPNGELYVATASGIGILSPDGKWRHLTGKEGGLPVNDVTCLSFAPDGTLWVGTKIGAARRNKDGQWNYRMGPRWMIGDEVLDIAAIENGGAWILTKESLTHLVPKKMTLRQKAKIYDEITQKRHVRYGAVTECYFNKKDDMDSWKVQDNDNDGLWTSIYLGAKCFEYAVTKDPEAKRLAKLHFDFMARLETASGLPGYVARSVRPDTFDPAGHEHYNYKGGGEWHESKSEPGWQWKSDTSSDELSGHYFAWGVYYDLIAKGDPKEEERVKSLVRATTNYLIDHDYLFLDVDGLPTRWGAYSPRLLNGDMLWIDERGLHSLCLMAHLKVAMHITGDEKIKQAYRELIDKYFYDVNVMQAKEMIPNNPYGAVNHSDDEMAWMAYYHLLTYPDEKDRQHWRYRYSAARSMRANVEEKASLYDFIFALELPKWAHVADGVDNLERWPLDLREWRTRNGHRDDVTVDKHLSRHNQVLLAEALNVDENVPHKWNHDPYSANEGSDNPSEQEGGPWLLPYWMAVYHGLIIEKE